MGLVDFDGARREERTIAGKKVSVSVVPRVRHASPPAKVALSLQGLLQGMKLTLGYFLRPWKIVTKQYPENRATLTFPERYRARLRFKYVRSDEGVKYEGALEQLAKRLSCTVDRLRGTIREHQQTHFHKCTGCQNCEKACPNGSIVVLTRFGEITEDKEVDRFVWRQDSCTFCNACVQACPFDAIEFTGDFENAVYDRRLLVYNLNSEAGPPASFVLEEEDPAVRKKMLDPRDTYGGPVPLNGHALPNLAALPVHAAVAPPTNGKSKHREASV